MQEGGNHQDSMDRHQQRDDENPVYRSRLVGKEFNNDAMDGIFARAPPLEALCYVAHEAATIRQGEDTHTNIIMINDVSRASLEAPAVRKCVLRSQKRT